MCSEETNCRFCAAAHDLDYRVVLARAIAGRRLLHPPPPAAAPPQGPTAASPRADVVIHPLISVHYNNQVRVKLEMSTHSQRSSPSSPLNCRSTGSLWRPDRKAELRSSATSARLWDWLPRRQDAI